MSSSLAFRRVRHLCSVANGTATGTATAKATATGTATATVTGAISVSKAKSKLKYEFDPDKAIEIYSSVSKHYPSAVSARYTQEITVRRLARSHRFSDIETIIESHKTDPQITQEHFLSKLIRSYGQAGMFDHALKTYNQMDDLGTPRSTISFNSLLAACVQSKLFEQVPKLFEEIPQKYNFSPDEISYGILVKSYCELGSFELAIDELIKMEDKGIEVSVVTYTTLIGALYRKGKTEEADKLWNEMIKKGCSPDVGAYNVRLKQALDGDPDDVKALIEEMSNAGLKPDTVSYNYLMTCYCKNGEMMDAKKIYGELKEKGCKPNAETFRTLLFYLCKHGQFDTGYDVFKKSVKVNKIPDFITLKYLVKGLAEKGNKKDAKVLIRTMKKKFSSNLLNVWKQVEEELGFSKETVETSE